MIKTFTAHDAEGNEYRVRVLPGRGGNRTPALETEEGWPVFVLTKGFYNAIVDNIAVPIMSTDGDAC